MNNLIGIDGGIGLSKTQQDPSRNSFFRDPQQMNLIKERILPQLIAEKRAQNNLSLRIWNAGCGKGEDLYSLGIILHELLDDISNWNIHLLGTDLNTQSLKKAIEASYPSATLQELTEENKKRWFIKKENLYQLNKNISQHADFLYLNLDYDLFPSIINGTNAQDLILCRNVLCQFPKEKVSQIMKKLNQSLVEGGFLILGAQDPIETNGTDLIFHHHSGLLFERPNVKKYQIKSSFTFKNIIPINMPIIMQLLTAGRWQEAIDAVQIYKYGNNSAFLNFAEATSLANLGELQKAIELCQQSILLDGSNKEAHLLLALIHIELNHYEKAIYELTNVIKLDKNYVIAYYELALLYLRTHQIEAGIKNLADALTLTSKHQPNENVSGGSGLTYGRLLEILKKEVELHTPQ